MIADHRQRELMCFLKALGTDATVVPYPAHSSAEESRG